MKIFSSPYGPALVAGVAALVGFLMGRFMWMELHLHWLIALFSGALLTICVCLTCYNPQQFIAAARSAWREMKEDWRKSHQSRVVHVAVEEHHSRRYSVRKQKLFLHESKMCAWGCALWDILSLASWFVVLNLLVLMFFAAALLLEVKNFDEITISLFGAVLAVFIICALVPVLGTRDIAKEVIKYKPRTRPGKKEGHIKWILGMSFRPDQLWAQGISNLATTTLGKFEDQRPRKQFYLFCDAMVLRHKAFFVEYNGFVTSIKLAKFLIHVLRGTPRFLWVTAVPFLMGILWAISKFFVILFKKLNTSVRRAVCTCSLVGYFSGWMMQYFGAHNTAPYMALGVGFGVSILQYWCYQLWEKHIDNFLAQPVRFSRTVA